jgi:hypothetical protein
MKRIFLNKNWEKKIKNLNKSADLYLLKKSIANNNNLKTTIYKTRENASGDVKYISPISKEWNNTVYLYNNNNYKNLAINNINISSIIQHYFNLQFTPKFINKKYKPRWVTRPSINKIYISNTEIKHTNSNAILTIYTFNREKLSLLKRIKTLRKQFLRNVKTFILKNKDFLKNNNLSKNLNIKWKKHLNLLRKFKLRLSINQYKFEENFLYKLNNIIGMYFNKRVEFNIINVKSIVYNSDIFTKLLADKLWKRKINIFKMMKFFLNKTILPNVNKIKERTKRIKGIDFNLVQNKYKNLHLISVLRENNLSNLLNELYNNNIIWNNSTNYNYYKIEENIFNSIRYKNMSGIKLEVKGRLTRRYKAERSLIKVKWKGTLRNIYSSYKGLPVTKMRGYISPNIQYTMLASKRRIGAFAVKGWVSGK